MENTKTKKITDEKFILNLFRNLYKLRNINVLAHQTMSVMVIKDRKGNEIVLHTSEHDKLSDNEILNIGFFYNESFYSFKTQITFKDAVYYLQRPDEIYETDKRQLNRYEIKENENILLKIGDHDGVFKVENISTSGLSFASDLDIEMGSIIRNIEIMMEDSQIIYVDAVVKHRNTQEGLNTYGVAFVDIDWFSVRELFLYIFKKNYPEVRILAEFDKDNIRRLFETYLERLPETIGKKRFEDMINTMNRIKNNKEISANLVYVKDNENLISTASTLRIYNRTFLGHQLVATPQSVTNVRSRAHIYYGASDYMINNKYFEYYISYYVTHLSWHDLMFQRIESYINDKSKFYISKIQFYNYNTGCNIKYARNEYIVEAMNEPESFIEYCNNKLEPIEIKAYSYDRDFYLEEIKQVYEALGLFIVRKLWSVMRNGSIVAYIIIECGSNGLNLFNLIDMARFIFIDENDKHNIIEAALENLLKYYRKYQKDNFNVVIQAEADDIKIEGLIPNQSWARAILNKEGAIEYRKLIKLIL
ncbi:MAG: PilZ domain-containing protein [Bacillota bacterium]|nr:PilZ domain-containing protein [Bacillota bacterium]